MPVVIIYVHAEITGGNLLHSITHLIDRLKKHAGYDNSDNGGYGEGKHNYYNEREFVAYCYVIVRYDLDGYP